MCKMLAKRKIVSKNIDISNSDQVTKINIHDNVNKISSRKKNDDEFINTQEMRIRWTGRVAIFFLWESSDSICLSLLVYKLMYLIKKSSKFCENKHKFVYISVRKVN